ncbi:hypothetical protein LOC67_03395 [Stieleria sp. JC731]|uniref:hypothetical protein n=1 Tax=Pirellulaceae TaxID=2691357 RepID=UPI001E4C110E|nr:hypothetical protein [Stieleria sp. JC731]MCC9599593.1 hypothetical protein [Stieleria sp. JC731]
MTIRTPIAGAVLIAALTFGLTAWDAQRNQIRLEAPSGEVSSVDEARIAESSRRLARAKFYDLQVIPLLSGIEDENRAAAERCLERVKSTLDRYHDGVDGFVKDMTSIRTRFGIIKRMPAGWWKDDGRVELYVQQKFEQHLFSAEKLVEDVSGSLVQFRSDIVANQNALLTKVQASLSTSDLPETDFGLDDAVFTDLSGPLSQYATSQGSASVELMIGAFVVGEVGAFAAQSVVGGLLARFAPSIAIGSAAGASATVGASASGAGGGSLGGPVGTAVGFGVGLAVGLIIDWWMTEKFEAKLATQMHSYLDELEATLVAGSPAQDSPARNSQSSQGLASALPKVCAQLNTAYRDRFFEAIVLTNPIQGD